jgi:hypothetical protein
MEIDIQLTLQSLSICANITLSCMLCYYVVVSRQTRKKYEEIMEFLEAFEIKNKEKM